MGEGVVKAVTMAGEPKDHNLSIHLHSLSSAFWKGIEMLVSREVNPAPSRSCALVWLKGRGDMLIFPIDLRKHSYLEIAVILSRSLGIVN